MSLGRSVRLFLVDGTPTGLLTAEIPNWTGHLLVAPRSRLLEALKRPECSKTGVYLLLGEEGTRPAVYVGEGDCIADRIKSHAKDPDKEFWERVCFVTSKDLNITKAHVRYLESRIVSNIRESGLAALKNGNVPPSGALPESDESDMEYFIEQLEILLPMVGFDVLRRKITAKTNSASVESFSLENGQIRNALMPMLLTHGSGVSARAIYFDGETTILRGSKGTGQTFKVNQYAPLRQQLIDEGKISLAADNSIVFNEDVPFKSPSAAAAVLNNRNSSGPREWKCEPSGESLREWLDSGLESFNEPLM